MTSLARRTDPATSLEAGERTQRKLNETQQRALSVTFLAYPRTAQEIGVAAAEKYGGLAETYRKRVGELLRLKRIQIVGVSQCTITGTKATTYQKVNPQ